VLRLSLERHDLLAAGVEREGYGLTGLGDGAAGGIVAEHPGEVLADVARLRAVATAPEVAAHRRHVGALDGDVRAGAHGDAGGSRTQRPLQMGLPIMGRSGAMIRDRCRADVESFQ